MFRIRVGFDRLYGIFVRFGSSVPSAPRNRARDLVIWHHQKHGGDGVPRTCGGDTERARTQVAPTTHAVAGLNLGWDIIKISVLSVGTEEKLLNEICDALSSNSSR